MPANDDREQLLKAMRTCAGKHARAKAAYDALEAERTELMRRARAITPRFTFAEIAEAFGIGETAVIQKIARADAAAAKAGVTP